LIFALVAVALGQQQPTGTWQNGPQTSPQTIDTTGMPLDRAQASPPGQPGGEFSVLQQPNQAWNQPGARPPATPQNPVSAANDDQRRGELGIWMGETGGPGVQILRVTSGSAADQAGLRVGDIILQVNGRGAVTPQETANLIKQINIGQTGTLSIWRNGNQEQVQITMQPLRERARDLASNTSRQVGFDGSEAPSNSDLAARTERLEQQINSLTQELASLRKELAQLRTNGPVQTGFNTETKQATPAAPPQDRYEASKPATPGPTTPPSPPPASAKSEEKPLTPPAATPQPAKPEAPPQPAAKTPPADDLFGPSSPPTKSEEKPKTEEKPKANDKSATDDLFK
jgi:hypothetical protein